MYKTEFNIVYSQSSLVLNNIATQPNTNIKANCARMKKQVQAIDVNSLN